jgi:serine/threonine protein phosphatase 1
VSLTFAIPDLHGRADLLEHAFAAIAQYASSGTIVALGDYIDRGPRSRRVIELLMAGPPQGFRLVCLKGNHEDMMVQAYAAPHKYAEAWMKYGGAKTLLSYGHPGDAPVSVAYVNKAHVSWVSALATSYEDTHRIFVHARIIDGVPLDKQSGRDLMWRSYDPDDPGGWGGKHVVHGHEDREEGPLHFPLRTNLDTRAWKTGRLVVGVFDDDQPGGPVGIIEVTGPTHVSSRPTGQVAL